MRALFAFVFGFAFASAASAQDGSRPPTFFVKDRGWTIVADREGCNAFNRPLEEFNVAPMNALMLSRFIPQPSTKLRLFYWPGAFGEDAEVTVTFALMDGTKLEYKGFGVEDFIIDIHDGLEEADIAAIDRSEYVTVRTTGVGDMAFLTGGIQDAAEYLLQCAKAVAPPE